MPPKVRVTHKDLWLFRQGRSVRAASSLAGVCGAQPPSQGRFRRVTRSGRLLDRCGRERGGVAVQGQIYPPTGNIYPPSGNTPPMSATCSVSLQHEGLFFTAQVLIVSPPGQGDVHVTQPYEHLSPHP